MNKLKDNDLREALHRRESRRVQTTVPPGFLDDVMQSIGQPPSHEGRAKRVALAALAVAASILLAVLITAPDAPQEKFPPREQPVCSVQTTRLQRSNNPFAACKQVETSVPAVQRQFLSPRHAPRKAVAKAQQTSVDSLAALITRIEQEMQNIRDSCYQANVERLIRADAHLQRLVNQLILDGMLADTTRIAAM